MHEQLNQDSLDHPAFPIEGKFNFNPPPSLPLTAVTCLNGLKHGATTRLLFIPGEDPQDFYSLLAECFETHQPSTTADAAVVTDFVVARWYVWRRQRAHYKREFELYNEQSQEDTLNPPDLRELDLFDRYLTTAQRAYNRAQNNLSKIKKDAAQSERWREQLALAKARYDLDRQRFEFHQTQDARVVPKITAEAALATKRAEESLARSDTFDNLLSSLKSTKPPEPSHLAMVENECVILQSSQIKEENGALTVVNQPSNEVVAAIIANAEHHVTPPLRVIRDFTFAGGFVPSRYRWLNNLVVRGPEANNAVRNQIICRMRFENWQILAQQEARWMASPEFQQAAA